MVSAQVTIVRDSTGKHHLQDEVVTFTSTIYPIDAKGMVEKWLLQVDFANKN